MKNELKQLVGDKVLTVLEGEGISAVDGRKVLSYCYRKLSDVINEKKGETPSHSF